MMDYLVVKEILLQHGYHLVYSQLKHQIVMLICLLYNWIGLEFVKIVLFIHNSIVVSNIQCSTYNLYNISIIATVASITSYTANRMVIIAIKLIEFNVFNVNLAVYGVITSVVSNIINIFHILQILCSKKFDNILFCLFNDIDINFRTHGVTSCYTSCTTVTAHGIDQIALKFNGIELEAADLCHIQAIASLVNVLYQIFNFIKSKHIVKTILWIYNNYD